MFAANYIDAFAQASVPALMAVHFFNAPCEQLIS